MSVALKRAPALKDQVYDRVSTEIRRSKPGTQLDGERELADRFGVSRPTVRKALARLEQEGLVERRQGDGTFVTEQVQTKLVRILHYHSSDSLTQKGPYADCYRAMREALEAAGHRVETRSNPRPRWQPGPDVGELGGEPSDAIVTIGIMNYEYLAQLTQLCGVLVTVDYQSASLQADSVVFDSFGAGQALAEHLCSLGHRRMAFIGAHRGIGGRYNRPRPELDSVRMRAGWEYGALEHGVDVRPDRVLDLAMHAPEDAANAAMRMFSEPDLPTAFVCRDASHAGAIVRAAREKGYRLPEDLSVACFGPPPSGVPEMTSVEVDMKEMGHEAGTIVVSRLDEGIGRRASINLPGTLVARFTTGPLRSQGGE